jgi:eukaryotic-like serine/threonine-protein kinase
VEADRTRPDEDLRERLQARLGASFTLERELGGGAMSRVFVAHDTQLRRKVVVKVLHPDLAAGLSARRFEREVLLAARLQHPHVLPLLSTGDVDGLPYYTMPYIEGESLRARLARDGRLAINDAVQMVRELADALGHAHAQGVVHRDLKPENVLLSGGHAVVADFGVSKALRSATQVGMGADAGTATGTALGVTVGTPAYMAPEQVAADPAVDHRADLYSLGVIAYELLAGAHPFVSRTSQGMLTAHLTQVPGSLLERRPDVPPALAALVAGLLAKDPAARPQSAEAVLQALDEISTTVPAPAVRFRWRTSAGLAALVLAAGTVGTVVWWRAGQPSGNTAEAVRAVAVLPLVNTSGDPQDDYFSDGLTDELAHALSKVPGLRIAGRSSSYAFKGKSIAAPEIGRALGVGALVEGTVRRAGERLRVGVQLVSTGDGTVLWDSVYESRSRDVFAVQDSLTRDVASALAALLGGRAARAGRSAGLLAMDVGRGTDDADAYEFYLKGMYYWHERGASNVMRSIDYFQQAIARDPGFARAYAGLAFAYNVLPVFVPDSLAATIPLLRAAALRAVTLDSTLADAQAAIALAFNSEYRFAEAEARYRAALAIEPSDQFVHHAFGFMLMSMGRTDEAIAELQEATRLDPLAKSAGTAAAEALINARRFRESEAESRRILAIDSMFPLAIFGLGLAQAFNGQPDSAVQTLERGVRLYPEIDYGEPRLLFAYAAAGRWDDAERMRAELRRPGVDGTDGLVPAFADLVFGDREPLVSFLMTEAGPQRLLDALISFCTPLLGPLAADERYRAAIRRLGAEPCPLTSPWPLPSRPGSARTSTSRGELALVRR